MQRRDFLTALGVAVIAKPLAVRAQASGRVYRVGVLNSGGTGAGPFEGPFMRGLARHGYVPDKNLQL
ncbi:MAG TPA: hypothetical protein VHU15_03085, partial [Stellaceae bacterium]|nr:hypothetical protein [Stellaceae bacterium]